jgi:hypothetical protein
VLKVFTFIEKKEILRLKTTQRSEHKEGNKNVIEKSEKLRSAYLYNAAFHQGRKDDMTGFPKVETRRGAFPRALGVRGIPPFCAHLENN